jgi:hypothetical protein
MLRPLMAARSRSAFRSAAAISCAFALTAFEPKASAQECSNPRTSTCINADTFWPHAGPQRFAAVGSTETVAPRQVAFGVVATYLSRPILLNAPPPGPGGTDQYAIDNQVNANFLFAYGVTEHLQLDLAAPITLVQDGAGTSPLTGGRALRNTAVRDMRFGLAYAIVPRERIALEDQSFSLLARMTFSAPIGDNQDFAGERTVVYAPSLAADYRIWRLFFGTDVGMRIRPTTEFSTARVGTQLTTAVGAGFEILPQEKLSVLAEGRIYPDLAKHPAGKSAAPSEWLLGLRSAPFFAGDLSFYAGGGGPIPISDDPITQPRFRFVLGITYAPTNRDRDKDGIPDRSDPCPSTPGVKGYEKPGCAPLPGESTSEGRRTGVGP